MNEPTSSEQELLQFLLGNFPDRIYFKDRESRFIAVSRALAEFIGAKGPEDLVGKTDFDLFTEEHARPAFEDERRIMATGQSIEGKIEKETLPDGRVGWAITTKMPLRNRRGEVIGTCGVSKDFTAQKTMEDKLQKANEELEAREIRLRGALTDLQLANEKMKAMQSQLINAEKSQWMGRLAFGVAHEIRNPLNILNMGLHYLSSDEELTKAMGDTAILGEMLRAISRADLVVTTLMDSSKADTLKLTSDDVVLPLEAALADLSEEIEQAGIAVEREFPSDIQPLRLDSDRIQQVFYNVLGNAVLAMPKGGTLRLEIKERHLDANEMAHDAGVRGGQPFREGEKVAEIVIEDSGPGFSKLSLKQACDPFYTTRATGDGVGLGLTMSQKLVELHGGWLMLGNRPEGGARVTIRLKAGESEQSV